MLSTAVDHSWDLTPVIDLIYSLSSKDDPFIAYNGSLPSTVTQPKESEEYGGRGGEQRLGNFDQLWEFLGQPFDTPPPIIAPTSLALGDSLPHAGRLNSDDLVSEQALCKLARWQDRFEETASPKDEILRATPEPSKRTKKPKKKKQGKEIFAQKAQLASYGGLLIASASTSEESDTEVQHLPHSPDRKSIIYEILYGNKSNGKYSTLYGNVVPLGSNSPLKDTKVFKHKDWPASDTAGDPHSSRRWSDRQDHLSAAAKKAKLVLRLCDKFPAEKDCIAALGTPKSMLPSNYPGSANVHVFVDVSNIMIGFQDCFKISRGMSISTRIPRVPFSFHNLTLILERGRPSAKRVLVGSDHSPAIDEAKRIGYETNILDRVHKAKELTPRQKKYLSGNGISEQSSGSETTAVYAPQKWVEQAVDEILHLKMLESIVDSREPSTMVLATGDAAEAEYSQGFLKMVERALEKGWKVELVSFRQNTSGAYKRGYFRSKWGKMFKIIDLDDYTEELVAV